MRKRQIYKAHPIVDGGLRSHVPTRPVCTTPHIRLLAACPALRDRPASLD